MRSPSGPSGVDRLLSTLLSRGVRRGILGASRGWLLVAVASWGVRRIRRANQPQLLYRGKLKPGQTLQIGHLILDDGKGERPKRRARLRRRG